MGREQWRRDAGAHALHREGRGSTRPRVELAADHVVWPVEYKSKYPYGGDRYPTDEKQPVCEVVTTMTWLSAHTTRVRVGSLVSVVPQRNPCVLGKQLATLDGREWRGRATTYRPERGRLDSLQPRPGGAPPSGLGVSVAAARRSGRRG